MCIAIHAFSAQVLFWVEIARGAHANNVPPQTPWVRDALLFVDAKHADKYTAPPSWWLASTGNPLPHALCIRIQYPCVHWQTSLHRDHRFLDWLCMLFVFWLSQVKPHIILISHTHASLLFQLSFMAASRALPFLKVADPVSNNPYKEDLELVSFVMLLCIDKFCRHNIQWSAMRE